MASDQESPPPTAETQPHDPDVTPTSNLAVTKSRRFSHGTTSDSSAAQLSSSQASPVSDVYKQVSTPKEWTAFVDKVLEYLKAQYNITQHDEQEIRANIMGRSRHDFTAWIPSSWNPMNECLKDFKAIISWMKGHEGVADWEEQKNKNQQGVNPPQFPLKGAMLACLGVMSVGELPSHNAGKVNLMVLIKEMNIEYMLDPKTKAVPKFWVGFDPDVHFNAQPSSRKASSKPMPRRPRRFMTRAQGLQHRRDMAKKRKWIDPLRNVPYTSHMGQNEEKSGEEEDLSEAAEPSVSSKRTAHQRREGTGSHSSTDSSPTRQRATKRLGGNKSSLLSRSSLIPTGSPSSSLEGLGRDSGGTAASRYSSLGSTSSTQGGAASKLLSHSSSDPTVARGVFGASGGTDVPSFLRQASGGEPGSLRENQPSTAGPSPDFGNVGDVRSSIQRREGSSNLAAKAGLRPAHGYGEDDSEVARSPFHSVGLYSQQSGSGFASYSQPTLTTSQVKELIQEAMPGMVTEIESRMRSKSQSDDADMVAAFGSKDDLKSYIENEVCSSISGSKRTFQMLIAEEVDQGLNNLQKYMDDAIIAATTPVKADFDAKFGDFKEKLEKVEDKLSTDKTALVVAKIAEFQQKLDQMEVKLSSNKTALVVTKIAEFEKKLEQMEVKLSANKTDLGFTKIAEFEKKMEQLDFKLSANKMDGATFSRLQKRLEIMEDGHAATNKSNSDLNNVLTHHIDDFNAFRDNSVTSESQGELKQAVDDIQAGLTQVRTRINGQPDLAPQVEELKGRMDRMDDDVRKMENEVGRINPLKIRVQSMCEVIQGLETRSKEQVEELKKVSAKVAELDSSSAKVTELKEVSAKLTALESTSDKVMELEVKLFKMNEDAEKSAEKFQHSIWDLQSVVQEVKSRVLSLQQEASLSSDLIGDGVDWETAEATVQIGGGFHVGLHKLVRWDPNIWTMKPESYDMYEASSKAINEAMEKFDERSSEVQAKYLRWLAQRNPVSDDALWMLVLRWNLANGQDDWTSGVCGTQFGRSIYFHTMLATFDGETRHNFRTLLRLDMN